jgi:uncharacterized protein YndB with AHSA1/START domain
MSDYGVVPEPGTLRMERLLPGPIERVWAYLTEPEKRAVWLAAGPMELREGGRVELRFRHADLSPQTAPIPERMKALEGGHTQIGTITRFDPPRLLSYTWGDPGNSEVTFELTPQGEKVLLVVTHRRLSGRPVMVQVGAGWHTHLNILMNHLMGIQPLAFWSVFTDLEAEYERRIHED